MKEAQLHITPKGYKAYGHELEPGDVLIAEDVYVSSDGTWKPCPCPGLSIAAGNTTLWIRLV